MKTRIRRIIMSFAGAVIVALFVVPPLLAPQYEVKQGAFEARILSSAAGMGMAGKPVMRAHIEDETGRLFWIGVPSTITVAPKTQIRITVWCETSAHESCIARYQRFIAHPD